MVLGANLDFNSFIENYNYVEKQLSILVNSSENLTEIEIEKIQSIVNDLENEYSQFKKSRLKLVSSSQLSFVSSEQL